MTVADRHDVPIEDGEGWWGGAVADGTLMPFRTGTRHNRDLAVSAGKVGNRIDGGNQSAPLLLSSHGRVAWSERPFAFRFADRHLRLEGSGIYLGRHGQTLRSAYLAASGRFFPPSGTAPAPEMFTGPQYNTWIAMPYSPTQDAVLGYARRILQLGLPPGVIMIDDNWAQSYGTWSFDRSRFPAPRDLVDRLHDWGFRVMLWVVPYVSADSATFRALQADGYLVRDAHGAPAIKRWWNGYSATLDLSHPGCERRFRQTLEQLRADTGVDGFKFDAGDLWGYAPDDRTHAGAQPVDLCEAWGRLGLHFSFNEYRACWKLGGQPLAQRLHDKPADWGDAGLGSLIPELVAQGLIGHPYTCPDMIGGGELDQVSRVDATDQEFFIRYTQVAALAPMLQFSRIPDLDDRHRNALETALAIRGQHLPLILRLVDTARRTGEPIVRHMSYHAPGLEHVRDAFFLGPSLIVAPVLTRGATTRTTELPAGTWEDDRGEVVHGPATHTSPVTLERIPRYRKVR
jgi:alpha-glucosidase (family GH31 glycosyl hydrolase)